jgi:glycosyltransferase involved in cell wall biosynthesis/peptidoglycan/xylan/chitin deacetylase (PgdA/CDA1 family)
MKIWHVGASSNPYRVDGVSRTVWLLSREQAKLGHDVTLIIDSAPDAAAIEMAREAGIKLVDVTAPFLSYASEIRTFIERERPEIVHMHSVFILRQSTMGRVLNSCGIPYVITPHGGLAPQVLRRGVVKKSIYAFLRERPRFMGSSAVAIVTPAEERAIRSFIPNYHRPIRWMPNPVEVDKLDPHRWAGVKEPGNLVFLGRFDVLVKGIDILVEIARLLPEVKFDLYGTEDPKTLEWLNKLRENLPTNVEFHKPIFGLEKAEMLSKASLYLQPSRWEGFPVSVAECLYLGVPSVIADTLDLAQLFFQHDLGLVIPLDPPRAAMQIRVAMQNGSRLREWSERGKQFAQDHFHPQAVAQKHVELYEEIIAVHTRDAAREYGEVRYGAIGPGFGKNGAKPQSRLMPAHVRAAMKENVSRVIDRSSRLLGRNGQPRTVVLCYHAINAADDDLSIDPRVFKQQILQLKDLGFEFLNFGDLIHRLMRWGLPKNNVACITFDDGYEDNLTDAAPILSEMGVPATTFVTTGLMAREAQVLSHFKKLTRSELNFLSPRQVEELSRAGFEIGAHTHSHLNMARLSPEQTHHEVFGSKAMLEEITGHAVRSFAYPFGKRNIHYTPDTVAMVREAGFRGAAAVAFRAVTSREVVRIFEIPRFFVTRGDTALSFEQKLKGHFDWLGSIQESTPAWFKAMVSPEDKYE